ncbi:MAG: hypothetical protein HY905_14275, partial [Deltaproteobacteria bacterium]|nr:hypothetical protein [Deltaproteobacteria bacterium]
MATKKAICPGCETVLKVKLNAKGPAGGGTAQEEEAFGERAHGPGLVGPFDPRGDGAGDARREGIAGRGVVEPPVETREREEAVEKRVEVGRPGLVAGTCFAIRTAGFSPRLRF